MTLLCGHATQRGDPQTTGKEIAHENSAITSTDRDSNDSCLEEVGTVRVHVFLFQRHIVAFRTLGDLYLAMKVPS